MTLKIIEIKDKNIWLAIDQLRMYTSDLNLSDIEDAFLCYYKLTEPTDFILGELFKETDGRPKVFNSIESAVEYAEKKLNKNS